MKKLLFIDRDGTLINEPPDGQIDSLEKLEFYPGVITWLGKIREATTYQFLMVTNQDGLGTSRFPEATFWPAHHKLIHTLKQEGIDFAQVHIDRSMPEENKNTRKPGIGMLTGYFNGEYDIANSLVIGDRLTDIELAKNLGCRGILLNNPLAFAQIKDTPLAAHCALSTTSWRDIFEFLVKSPRCATINRKTAETDVTVSLNLDGTGNSSIATGIGFFDHMLEQVARHGQVDLQIITRGDLHIDEHHTIEDTALALGAAFARALGDKRGIERYGYCVPMDDCLAQVAVDFGGRPWLVWDAVFLREKIGQMPGEMFHHFFKSFADAAHCNLHIKATGENEHHKAESIFKAFAKSLKMAKLRSHQVFDLPSTKGTL